LISLSFITGFPEHIRLDRCLAHRTLELLPVDFHRLGLLGRNDGRWFNGGRVDNHHDNTYRPPAKPCTDLSVPRPRASDFDHDPDGDPGTFFAVLSWP
jgi:hypothetical protein